MTSAIKDNRSRGKVGDFLKECLKDGFFSGGQRIGYLSGLTKGAFDVAFPGGRRCNTERRFANANNRIFAKLTGFKVKFFSLLFVFKFQAKSLYSGRFHRNFFDPH